MFLPTAERSLRPHIRLYHTIVPCRCCGDGACCGRCSSDCGIWIEDMLSIELKPKFEPPKPDGIIPLLMQGTPSTGKGSSGGVTCRLNFKSNEYSLCLCHFYTSSPMLPLSAILIGFEWLLACINVVKWLMPISSRDDFRRPETPTFGKPCLNEFDRLNSISLSI